VCEAAPTVNSARRRCTSPAAGQPHGQLPGGDRRQNSADIGIIVLISALLAGIAAADAACCGTAGRRSRGQDHRQAIQLVTQAGSDGKTLARALGRLLDIKDNAHYGMVYVGAQQAKAAIRHAKTLVDGATQLLV
jgi:hypothetical protein